MLHVIVGIRVCEVCRNAESLEKKFGNVLSALPTYKNCVDDYHYYLLLEVVLLYGDRA